jgi:hypothetical protein
MKKTLIIVLLAVSNCCHSQTWAEWFQQKKTQKKYLLEQIAALQVYFGYVKDGYSIARKGLNTINDIKNGEFNLHDGYFISLKAINPKIKSYAKVADIISYQIKIVKQTKECMIAIRELDQFTLSEIEHCAVVFNNLLSDCLKNIDELVLLVTAGKVEMKDDERLTRIDVLYVDMQNKYGFCSSYSEEMTLLTVQRMREQYEINLSKKLNGLQ